MNTKVVVNTISLFISWVFANTMSPCLNHESMSIPWVHACTISLSLYHEFSLYHRFSLYHQSFSNPCFHFYTIRNTVFNYTEIQKKDKFQKYRNKTCRFIEIQVTVIQIYKIPNWRNTTCRIAEIQTTWLQKYKWLLNNGLLRKYG